ncbi:M23 family metallopeptidase [Agromyces sp. NPDC060279]|uniref:M23 family metallopeptidase n=1 Tax=Agromyces sp. NPDC060279 TaxID=3347092 RepID=UPI00365EBE25
MLESPLVPDGSTPGTQTPSRSERPLTRRELRERERAAELAATPTTPAPAVVEEPTGVELFDAIISGEPVPVEAVVAAAEAAPAQVEPHPAARIAEALPAPAEAQLAAAVPAIPAPSPEAQLSRRARLREEAPQARSRRLAKQPVPTKQTHPATAPVAGRPARSANAAFAGTAPARARRSGAKLTSLVAMSFAALLAVATSVPSLSLLSSDDVQAMALTGTDSGREAGQTLDTSGDAIAATPELGLESYKSQSIAEYAAAAGIRPEATFTNNPNGTIQWPFAVGVHIGDRFGYRDCAGCSSDHHGQDFNPGLGADIQAIADGVVSQSTDEGGSLGTVVMIDHVINGQTITSVYAHMIEGSRTVEIGDTVHVGQVIGETGNTGMSTGPHLHFEIRIGGINGTWVDPLEWLYANTN